jgi:hypothetical protein
VTNNTTPGPAGSPVPARAGASGAPTVLWAYTDGKAGHENQTRGLVQALAQTGAVDVHWMKPARGAPLWLAGLRGRYPAGAGLPDPDLHIGAGHATHLALLLARRARGGRCVVLMKPSLPRGWFDLCVVPEHDQVTPAANVLVTRGALTAVTPGGGGDPAAGLLLIGGPSRHHAWSDRALAAQVAAIVQRAAATHWTLTTSRRTPPPTLALLRAIRASNLVIVPFADTDRHWLPAQLARAATVWVSEDSVSMVYEALTAGAATGLLAVPRRRASRIGRAMDNLVRDKLVLDFSAWQAGASLAPPATTFNEAARVAAWIRTTWPHAR